VHEDSRRRCHRQNGRSRTWNGRLCVLKQRVPVWRSDTQALCMYTTAVLRINHLIGSFRFYNITMHANFYFCCIALLLFSALTLLAGRQEEHLAFIN